YRSSILIWAYETEGSTLVSLMTARHKLMLNASTHRHHFGSVDG
ncbi:hypothetical protein NPIL_242481, partial [Nephila pilipes]